MTPDELLDLYARMMLMRRFEEKTAEMYQREKVTGFCHLYIGEEAVATGLNYVLTEKDYVITAYRDHGHALARGMAPERVMAELFGRSGGVSRGRGGSMHLYSRRLKFFGGDAIVGGHLPIACGLGFAVQYRREDAVVACVFGDGAINEGAFHEAMNLASLWRLPVVFICENNEFGMGTAVARASAYVDLSKRATGYNMRIDKVDGMDVLAVIEVCDRAVRYVKSEKRPTFIEAVTYRFRGHSMSDPARYRTKDDVSEWQEKDPLKRLQRRLIDAGMADEEALKAIRRQAVAAIDKAVEFADASPWPEASTLTDHVFADYDPPEPPSCTACTDCAGRERCDASQQGEATGGATAAPSDGRDK
jgi:pyruvate dehydrogenase E1 component alpha subunit